jgi:predicted glycogen debranching enzyme
MKPDTDGRASRPEPALSPLVVGREACVDYGRSSELEWLEANGTGGFAMGTVAGSNTRRYHGLLVASLHPPVERVMTLSRLEETVLRPDGEAPLSTNQYPGTLYPKGFQALQEFRLYPCPTWTFQLGQLRLERRLFLVAHRQMLVVTYRANQAVRLRLSPLLAFRDYHSLGYRADAIDASVREETEGAVRRLTFQPRSSLPPLFLHHPGLGFEGAPEWHENVEYLRELDRGLDFREDLFLPGSFLLDVGPETFGWAVASLEADVRIDASTVQGLERDLLARRQEGEPVQARWRAAAEQFLVTRADGSPTVLAGYPWFTDWGRDTMISIPGLLLTTGKLPLARRVLEGFLGHLDGGLVPNRFPDQSGPAEYNTVDATLWMFQAVHAYLAAGGGRDFLKDVFYPAARDVVDAHLRGTHHDIRADAADGLLLAGGPGSNLTWMDARVDGQPVTPRHGKPVEVNALWYNALRLMERWAKELEDGPGWTRYGALAARAGASFERVFWNPARDCLYDVILPEGPDGRLRPNQLLALSLAFPLLDERRRRAVLHRVESELLTPMGLRTLARGEPGYAPSYRGGPAERDAAYHQGLVWPWLLGPFVDGYLLVHGSTDEARAHCRLLLRGLEAPFGTGCLGSLSECFEAEPPFRAVAAPAQAWSVAELLRVRTVLARGAASEASPRGS